MVTKSVPKLSEAKFKRGNYPEDVSRHVLHALAKYVTRDFESALESWSTALSLAPQEGSFYFARGVLLNRLGRFEPALQDLDAAIALSVPEDMEVDLHAARAITLHNLGRAKEAFAELDTSLRDLESPDISSLRTAILTDELKALVKKGFASWSGKKPKGSKNPVRITPGPPVSDYVIQDRG